MSQETAGVRWQIGGRPGEDAGAMNRTEAEGKPTKSSGRHTPDEVLGGHW
jgi:hypothetical protein